VTGRFGSDSRYATIRSGLEPRASGNKSRALQVLHSGQ